jgi:hypothetical protein
MADLQSILNKFTELGIENKGLVPDDPMTQGKALKEQYGNDQSADTNSHARMVAESIKGKHIPGVSDVSSSDMAALAGVKQTTTSTQPTPTMNVMNTAPITSTSTTDKWNEVDARLSNIESKLSSIVESIQRLSEISDEDYREKRKALHDLEMNPQLQDKESKEAIKKRKLSLEKERKETTKESLEKGFASFLKELEKN